eukprot:GDKJ01025674.1.p1 GENE.GDKJ01025674.1~~GDKJ01025674.1.p1  ORF type:complete len:882 (-),score=268.10 GDKJ01025674.1:304-2949(-)
MGNYIMVRIPLTLAAATFTSAYTSSVALTSSVQVTQLVELESLQVTEFSSGLIDTIAERLHASKAEIYSCVEGMEKLDDVYREAMEDIMSKDITRMLKGIQSIVNLYTKDGMSAAQACQSISLPDEQRQVVMRVLQGLTRDPAYVSQMLFKNVVDNAFKLASSYISYTIAKKNGKEYEAGHHMAETVYYVLFGKGTMKIQNVAVDGKALLTGVSRGLVGNFPTLSKCAADAASFYPEVSKRIHEIESGNIIEKAKAALALEKLFKSTLKPWMATCIPGETNKNNKDYARILALYQLLQTNPATLMKLFETHILENSDDMEITVKAGLKALEEGKWDIVGENLGHIISVILFDSAKFANLLLDIELSALTLQSSMEVAALTLTKDEAARLLRGVFTGFGSTFDELWGCVAGSVELTRDLLEAIRALDKKDAKSILDAIVKIATILRDQALPTVQHCGAAPSDIKKIKAALAALSSPTSFFTNIGKNIVVNGREIIREVKLAINAEKVGDLEAVGDAIGVILSKMLFGEAFVLTEQETRVLLLDKATVDEICIHNEMTIQAYQFNELEVSGKEVADVAIGLVEGFISEYKDLKLCVQDLQTLVPHLAPIVKKLSEHKSITDVKEALKALADLFKTEVLPAMKECKGAAEDIKALIDAFNKISNPKSFIFEMGRHIIVNGKDIIHEISNLISAFKTQDYRSVGFNIGLMVKQIVIGELEMEQLALQATKAVDITKGVVHGFFKESPQIDACINASSDLIPKLAHAVELLRSKTLDGVKNGLAELGKILHDDFANSLKECKDSQEELKALLDALKAIQNPKEFFYTIGKHLIVNNKDILQETVNAINAYKAEDFETFGFNVGLALHQTLIGLETLMIPTVPVLRV